MHDAMPVKLTWLENYYENDMVPREIYVQTFDFRYNAINCTILLDMSRREINALDLYFIKRNTQDTLSVPMDDDFCVKAHDPEKYSEIKNFFNIKNELNSDKKFNLIDFFKYMDTHLHPAQEPQMDRQQKARFYRVEDPDAIFYKTMILWDIVHREQNTNRGNVTERNRAKVQKLLPDLYARIRNKNISVRFTANHVDENREQNLIDKELNKHNL